MRRLKPDTTYEEGPAKAGDTTYEEGPAKGTPYEGRSVLKPDTTYERKAGLNKADTTYEKVRPKAGHYYEEGPAEQGH